MNYKKYGNKFRKYFITDNIRCRSHGNCLENAETAHCSVCNAPLVVPCFAATPAWAVPQNVKRMQNKANR